MAHMQWLPGVQLKHFSTTCVVHIEDCEGWWLSSCRSSVAEHWLYKPGGGFDSRRLPAFSLSSISPINFLYSNMYMYKSSKNLLEIKRGVRATPLKLPLPMDLHTKQKSE